MAHNAEPMDIDDESVFDNKENAYQHSNVLPRTPCTEKGYEELDVSELNMKLRYSITPAASPMSKSMSHCLDSKQNTTDESLNNTVIHESENNLTRSLNSTLNKTEVKSSKVLLPLQALPADIVDNNRSSVLRPLDTATENDITITVSNEIDNLSFASSSSSMAHTPEATTPTKEIPKHDGGSPIMRGLKSVLSMFRSSQSPIPPGEEDAKVANPDDVPLPESKPGAIASTPKNENNKERSLSRRNSPHKEPLVFNEDLEKELQWNDDSTIVFSSEKIPIHKLFFQDRPSNSANFIEHIKHEDANSTVEYMDVSYNDLSVKDKTLNGTVNRTKNNDLAESDGEFVDCETTFTQNDAHSKTEVLKINSSQTLTIPEKKIENISTVNVPISLDTTKDIINSIETSHIVVEGNPLDFSTTDIVNQLSDLINDSGRSATNVLSVANKETVVLETRKTSTLSDVQPELLENQVISPVKSATESSVAVTEQVSKNEDFVHTSGIVYDTIVESSDSKIGLETVDANAVTTDEDKSPKSSSDETKSTKAPEESIDNAVGYLSPVDIPLPNDDDINEINDNFGNEVCTDFQEKSRLISSISQNETMANKSITEATRDIQHLQFEPQTNTTACPPSLLPSDFPLPNTDIVDTNNFSHEVITVVCNPVQSPAIEKSDTLTCVIAAKVDLVNDAFNKSTTETTTDQFELKYIKADIPCSLSPSDIPLPGMDDDNPTEAGDLAVDNVIVVTNSFQQSAIETPKAISDENNSSKVDLVSETNIIERVDISVDEVSSCVAHDILPVDLNTPKQDLMEISYVESTSNKLFESVALDVSMAEAKVEVGDTLDQPESCGKETPSFNILSNIPKVISHNVEVFNNNIVNCDRKSASFEIGSCKEVNETSNQEIVSELVSLTNHNLSDTPKSSDPSDEIVNVSIGLTSKAKATNEVSLSDNSETNVADDNNKINIANDSNMSHVLENATDSSMLPVPTVTDKKETCDAKCNTALPELPKGRDTTINLDSSCKIESTLEYEEKLDEEIVLSESNSPFVSMSVEAEFGLESKKEEFEKIEHPISTKSKVAQSPPMSPKIISKGYNLNFDDIDNINPFATKTKIRMSPPPDASPNTSLVKEDVNKTEIVEPLKNDKNVSRRKSMPERKKPLKAKRHLNSSIDSTEKVSSKITSSKNRDLKITPVTELQQKPSFSQPEPNETNITNVPSDIQGVTSDKLDAAIPSEIATFEEPEAVASEHDPNEHKSMSIENETNITQNNETKVIENVVMSASSSEQSTYFSAGASSTEITESKNVFNLPELDDINSFAMKSKMHQSLEFDTEKDLDTDNPFATRNKIKSSPETSIVVTENNCNRSVIIDNEKELKDATCNLSACSESSKTSEEKDITVHEVHTEDEDTLEGPFLEADDGHDSNKKPQFADDKIDVVDFDNLNQPDKDDAAEMFIDAEAFEFLMNQNKTDDIAYSGKESLFLKFDPLFARRVTSEGVAAALNDIKRKQITPKKLPKQAPPKEVELLSFEKPVAGPSEFNITSEVQNVVEEKPDDSNVTNTKPMMAVTPAVNPVVTPRKPLTPNRSNRLSMTFTSPAMAVIDRLLSLSGNSPSAGLDATVTHVDRSQSEADQALTQLRELLAEKEINVYNLRCESKELKDRLSTLETQMEALEAESAERLKKVNELTENLAEKTKMNRNMAAVVEEYERTIASLISETEQDKKRFADERNQLIRDRDEQTAHLSSMEVSFNDLHSKYEKSKQVIMGYKSNEDAYKKSIQEFEENLAKMHANYELLKQHATSKLNHANQELEKINKAHESEVLKFNAMIKRKELHITSLEESLTQKTKANEELTAICDELINKVG